MHIGQIARGQNVAPFTGAWIEIRSGNEVSSCFNVAPFTGAWIEIAASAKANDAASGRSLHGSVD